MATTYKVKLGPVANSYFDLDTGIFVIPGKEVELRSNQYHNPRIQQAIFNKALVLVPSGETKKEAKDVPDKYSEEDVEKALEKAKKQYDKGVNIDKIASKFDHDLILKMAENQGLELEEGDTDVTILQAILEDDSEEEDPNGSEE